MTTAQQWLDLAARIEAATGADRELGRELLLACGWTKTQVGHFLGPLYGWTSPDKATYFQDDNFVREKHDPTASLDAAMKLVPEGLAFAVATIRNGAPDDWDDSVCSAVVAQRDGVEARSDATTPALALCAAACRARAGMEG
ncbi:hypothetical protein GCM10023232_26650 [Sphingosinicella ginsenosidimutans]|uniref:Uncharacterized protein n=1 Tax=Allosphingosinicella ginsenosidimutans TaxID=1176539 RepID=A0A5C6TVJ1_9SPHN|nr:hypothetical protein [Sphingosinicella ginsenosidimutans]TXC63718.1 hypothetical protein FRZ32_08630 [Sphingosinicella ginsenosidimutans]